MANGLYERTFVITPHHKAKAPRKMSSPETPTYDGEKARRTGRAIGGGILATIGVAIALGGGAILAVGGGDNTFSSGTHDVSSRTSALVTTAADLDGVDDLSDVIGQPRVHISAQTANPDKAVFVGVAPKAQVDRYLEGVSIDRVTDVNAWPWSLSKHVVEGSRTPVPPARKSFWVAKSMGSTASIDWKVSDGKYRVVVMNADGSRGVSTDSSVGVKIPYLATIAIVMLVLGLLLVAAALALIIPAMRGGGSGARPTPPQPAPQAYAIG